MQNKVIVKLDNISKKYKDKYIIKNTSLDVYEGEFLTLLGASGCGKTTILRAIRGVEHIDEGSISVGDVSINEKSSQYYYNELKKETAIHLQRSFGIWPDTVRENVLRKLYSR